MQISFDTRVLQHRYFTGVENYAKAILQQLSVLMDVVEEAPRKTNTLLAHLHTHCILPFTSNALLFCPANIAPLYFPKRKKLVVTIHDVAFMRYPQSFSLLFRYYYRFVMPRVIRRADAIITISNSSKEEILNYYPEATGKIEVIPLGVDTLFLNSKRMPKQQYILYVGSFNERKNFQAVLEAFSQLHVNYELVMVGNVSKNFSLDARSHKLLEAAKKNEHIIFKHYVERKELLALYSAATVLVFPSFYEGFGLPPLEAMACGTPVITSHTSSMPEVCGDAALYVDPNNIEEIALTIETLCKDRVLQQSMIAKGDLHVKAFCWDKAALQHQELFERVLHR